MKGLIVTCLPRSSSMVWQRVRLTRQLMSTGEFVSRNGVLKCSRMLILVPVPVASISEWLVVAALMMHEVASALGGRLMSAVMLGVRMTGARVVVNVGRLRLMSVVVTETRWCVLTSVSLGVWFV